MRPPHVICLERNAGHDGALVVIRGFLSSEAQSHREHHDWTESLRQYGWRGAIYAMWWDAFHEDEILRRTSISNAGKLAILLNPLAAIGHVAFEAAGSLAVAAGSVFREAEARADEVAEYHFWDLLSRVDSRDISVLGFSLAQNVREHARF